MSAMNVMNGTRGAEVVEGSATKLLPRAGALIVLGLLIQLGTFFFVHPAAFLSFTCLGCTSVLVGVALAGHSLRKAAG